MSVLTTPAPPDAVYARPRLYPLQEAALFTDARYALIEASSKSGKTVGAMAWLLEQALIHRAGEGRNFWWVSPIYAQSKIPFRRMKRQLRPSAGAFRANESELTITLPNETVLWFKGGDQPDALYGEDVYAAVVDEASRVKEESWHALRSTLTATRGPVRLIGNVKGRRNWFYALARRAEAGEPDMHYARITAYDAVGAGVLSQSEVEDARRVLPEAVYRELYLAEPSDDAGNPFGLDAIRRAVAPLAQGPPAAFGVDLAKSVDWSVVIGLDGAGAVCAFDRFQAPWDETTARVLRAIGPTPALVDSTGVGDPILERLQRSGANAEGYPFTAPSKQRLMEGLAAAIQQGEVHFPTGPITAELDAFEYEYTRTGVRYSAPEGLHDDCVMSLALAVRHRTMAGVTRFF
jgi:Terminase large subunit, T4likevirus-type, N-terminal